MNNNKKRMDGKLLIIKPVMIGDIEVIQLVDSTFDATSAYDRARELGEEHMIIHASAINNLKFEAK